MHDKTKDMSSAKLTVNPNGVPYAIRCSVRAFEGSLSFFSLHTSISIKEAPHILNREDEQKNEDGSTDDITTKRKNEDRTLSVMTILALVGCREEDNLSGDYVLTPPSDVQKNDIRLFRFRRRQKKHQTSSSSSSPSTFVAGWYEITYELYRGGHKLAVLPPEFAQAMESGDTPAPFHITIQQRQQRQKEYSTSTRSTAATLIVKCGNAPTYQYRLDDFPIFFERGGSIFLGKEETFPVNGLPRERLAGLPPKDYGLLPKIVMEKGLRIRYFSHVPHQLREKTYPLHDPQHIKLPWWLEDVPRPTAALRVVGQPASWMWEKSLRGTKETLKPQYTWAADDFLEFLIPLSHHTPPRVRELSESIQRTQSALYKAYKYRQWETKKKKSIQSSLLTQNNLYPFHCYRNPRDHDCSLNNNNNNDTQTRTGTIKQKKKHNDNHLTIFFYACGILCVAILIWYSYKQRYSDNLLHCSLRPKKPMDHYVTEEWGKRQ
jgi:hypothetical protein